MAAEEAQTEIDPTVYLGKEATKLQARFSTWIQEYVGYNPVTAKTKLEAFQEGVRIATATRMVFQASDYNREANAAERQANAEARAEREAAAEEAAKAAEPAPAKAAPPKAAKKAPAKKAPAKAAAAPAAAAEPAVRRPARRAPAAAAAGTSDAPF